MKFFVQLFRFISSLRLTIVLLAFSLILVFFGTLDQVKWGIHHTQKLYFESFVVYCPAISLLKTFLAHSYDARYEWFAIPLPGGFTLGALLLANLTAAHFRYFKFGWNKIGISILHFGVLLLLISGFMVSFLQQESVMTLEETGAPVSYTSDFYRHEIYLKDTTDAHADLLTSVLFERVNPKGQTLALPQQQNLNLRVLGTMKNSGAGLRDQLLPQYEDFLHNNQGTTRSNYSEAQWRQLQRTISGLKNPDVIGIGLDGNPTIRLTQEQTAALRGFAGTMGGVLVEQPETFAENTANARAAVVEVSTAEGEVLGIWILSSGFGPMIPAQTFEHNGHEYELGLRALRYYLPFTLDLQEARHDLYPGTEIPRNFSSQVIITHAESGEVRPALIYMNNPLRYGGLTFYQYQMQSETGRSVLQVVHNPSWLVPYIAVGLVGLGMLIQFGLSFQRFSRRRTRKGNATAPTATNSTATDNSNATPPSGA